MNDILIAQDKDFVGGTYRTSNSDIIKILLALGHAAVKITAIPIGSSITLTYHFPDSCESVAHRILSGDKTIAVSASSFLSAERLWQNTLHIAREKANA